MQFQYGPFDPAFFSLWEAISDRSDATAAPEVLLGTATANATRAEDQCRAQASRNKVKYSRPCRLRSDAKALNRDIHSHARLQPSSKKPATSRVQGKFVKPVHGCAVWRSSLSLQAQQITSSQPSVRRCWRGQAPQFTLATRLRHCPTLIRRHASSTCGQTNWCRCGSPARNERAAVPPPFRVCLPPLN